MAAALLVAGCASPLPIGTLVTQVKLPAAGGDGVVPRSALKRGVSECKSYFGMVAVGDASVDTAVRAGRITKIHYVDWEADNILGIIGTYRCVVYGE